MAVFTRVTEAELIPWLSQYSLGSLQELQGIPAGIENTNYFVTTSNGRFVLTLFEILSAQELPFYLNLMAHLARHGIPCPSPVADKNNRLLGECQGKPACIVSRLSGKSVVQPSVTQCAAVGAMLGQLHSAGQSFNERIDNPRGEAWRNKTAEQVLPFLTAEETRLLKDELNFQQQNSLQSLPTGVVHADLFRDNVLMEGERVGGLIDFYFACHDVLLYDVAITVNDWCMDENSVLNESRTRAFLTAYHATRPLTTEEAHCWPVALRLAALRFWLSRLFDLHLPREGEMVNPHNPAVFKHILQQHIATAAQAVWLSEVA
jgi:homoserine kinase type II